ncbi:hypothetical protein E1301_Tti003312 [Triplophysa tibetana]|uniref:Uncharacterized protein n=1 Tax=Triplophysa tibetana TaxID=1572043 RepID=A0A5A9PNZ6_9TELE|nr:hypothetical protein E1301_Tti003312 [Triplophysa tibetana]
MDAVQSARIEGRRGGVSHLLLGLRKWGREKEDEAEEEREDASEGARQISTHNELVQTDGARVTFATVKSALLQIEQILRRPLASKHNLQILYGSRIRSLRLMLKNSKRGFRSWEMTKNRGVC